MYEQSIIIIMLKNVLGVKTFAANEQNQQNILTTLFLRGGIAQSKILETLYKGGIQVL